MLACAIMASYAYTTRAQSEGMETQPREEERVSSREYVPEGRELVLPIGSHCEVYLGPQWVDVPVGVPMMDRPATPTHQEMSQLSLEGGQG